MYYILIDIVYFMSNSNKLQNKKSKINEEEEIKRESEDKAKMEAERKAQSIQDKAKMEAERKAQSITQQAEDKAKQEAEKIKQTRQILNTTNDSYLQEESKNFELDSNKNIGFLDPFMRSVSMWQNYSLLWMNLTKEILSNSTRISNNFENTIRKYKQHQAFD